MAYELRFPAIYLEPDPLGVPYGPDYVPVVRAGVESSYTTDYLFTSRKNGRTCDCLGMGEKWMAWLLEISPFVLAYRCQYPLLLQAGRDAADEFVCGIRSQPPKLRRRDIMSLDIVVTGINKHDRLDYTVLSHKTEQDLGKPKVKRRIARERTEADIAGYRYIVFSRDRLLDECGKSARQISLWGGKLDFNSASSVSRAIAEIFYREYDCRPLDAFMRKVGRRLDLSLDQTYEYFSAAVNLGFIYVNLSYPVRTEFPVCLIQPNEAVPPWISYCGTVNYSLVA
ncbi:TnsA endonuclease N-terminal domain-containing protein [Paraburkholderia sp. Cpub6]|uniref:TnsA endonuclease N-terminal domain-containing protein n=1 Tax=Paraburkholderia sp. Cpub6 TaxID=2723094 RepID=UPI001622D506|nr:TnsA endonuclease N-terminal domain-containing protein [Paraburkholderia sp. Cpub6]MBB5460252.1 hypothetical protein [Paraburkholderia sp. Cpub6]